jgi:hypothetical protein
MVSSRRAAACVRRRTRWRRYGRAAGASGGSSAANVHDAGEVGGLAADGAARPRFGSYGAGGGGAVACAQHRLAGEGGYAARVVAGASARERDDQAGSCADPSTVACSAATCGALANALAECTPSAWRVHTFHAGECTSSARVSAPAASRVHACACLYRACACTRGMHSATHSVIGERLCEVVAFPAALPGSGDHTVLA